MKKVVIIGSLAILLAGGFFYYKKQIDLLYDLEYLPLGFHLQNLSGGNVSINLKLRIKSKSTISAEVTNLNLDVYVADRKLGNVREEKPLILPARGYSDIDVTVTFNPKEVGFNIADLLSNLALTGDTMVKFNGYGTAKSAFLTLNLPFTYETPLKSFF